MGKIEEIEAVWFALNDIEKIAQDTMRVELSPWEDILKTCVEAGILAPVLPAKNHGCLSFAAAAPFLKRSINDLRCIWLLISKGYTSQGASVAASIFENALTAAVLADSEELAKEAIRGKYSEIPWGAKKLAQLNALRCIKLERKQGKKVSSGQYEDYWTIAYHNYKWLCQIKHPTWQSVMHDCKSTIVKDTEYAVLPLPNNSHRDMQLKYCVLGGSVAKVWQAIQSYAIALECDETSKEYIAFEEKINKVYFGAIDLMKKYKDSPSPIR